MTRNQNLTTVSGGVMIISRSAKMTRRRVTPENKSIKFEVIPLAEVPSREPSTKPSSNPKGSQWDRALEAIERGRGGQAIKVIEPDPKKRNWLKSTLQTMARKRGCFVEVRDDATSVYAWASEKGGRFSRPSE
jgi:hypothetical protein